ncbi:MAG: class I SAM-dependent methyltransferase [Halobacteriota archaeon]
MRSTHKWDAAEYEKHSSQQQLWARDVIRSQKLAGDERILDIGSGDGKVTAELAARVPKGCVLGIDLSESMVAFAHRRFPPVHYPNLQFRCGNATRLAFRCEFDLVVSFASLHWVSDHIAVLKGIKRSLKSEGRTVLQFGGKGNAAMISDLANELIMRSRWKGYFKKFTYPWFFYSVEEYRGFIERAGLSARRIQLVPKDMVHGGRDALNGWVRSVFIPYTERLPEALREDFVGELGTSYVERFPPDENGGIHMKMVRLEVEVITSGN